MKYFLILLFVSIICDPSAEESENDIASENSEQIFAQSGSLIESANAPTESVEDDEQCVANGELTVLQKMYNAAATGDFEGVRRLGPLLEESGDEINDPVMKGQTVLFAGCVNGSLPIVKYLEKQMGADLTAVDEKGFDCIYVAATQGNTKLFKYLALDKDISPLRRYEDGHTAFHGACSRPGKKMQKIVNLAEKAGVDLDAPKKYGETCLMLAVTSQDLENVRFLLKKKRVNPNESNQDGRTALHYAFHAAEVREQKGDLSGFTLERIKDIIYNLIREDADIWILDNYRHSPLEHRYWNEFIDVKPKDKEGAPDYNRRVSGWLREIMPKRKKRKGEKAKSTNIDVEKLNTPKYKNAPIIIPPSNQDSVGYSSGHRSKDEL